MWRYVALTLACALLGRAEAQIINTIPNTFVDGAIIDAGPVNANFSSVASQINANAATSGANSTITALLGLTTPLSVGQGGSSVYTAGTSTGSANSQVVSTPNPSGFTLSAGKTILFTAGFTNNGATQFNINSTGLTDVYRVSGSGLVALTGGEVVSGALVVATYNGSRFVLTSGYTATASYTAGTSTGSANAQVISTTPTGFALVSGTKVSFIAGYTNTGALQVNVGGTGLVNVYKQYPSAQVALVGGEITAGSTVDMYYDGVKYLISGSVAVPASLPGTTGFTGVNNTGTPTGKYDLAATSVVVTNARGAGVYFGSPSGCTVNFSVTNIHNGLDTGSVATSTWYYIYYGSDGINLDCFASASATAPTVPTGYYFARVGAIKTDGSAQLTRVAQRGDMAVYTTQPSITPGAGAQNISLFFPDTALSYKLLAVSSGATFSIYTGGLIVVCGINTTTGVSISTQVECPMTGSTFVASGTATLYAYGWRDNAAVH